MSRAPYKKAGRYLAIAVALVSLILLTTLRLRMLASWYRNSAPGLLFLSLVFWFSFWAYRNFRRSRLVARDLPPRSRELDTKPAFIALNIFGISAFFCAVFFTGEFIRYIF